MDELMSGIIPSVRTFLHRDQVLLDTMPLIMHIAIPNLRSVSINLLTFEFLNWYLIQNIHIIYFLYRLVYNYLLKKKKRTLQKLLIL